jgi:hypothetical protein
MGLPKAFQAFQLNAATRGPIDQIQRQKADLWSSLCAVDRLFGMVTNLPPGTMRYQQTKAQALVVNDTVQVGVYLTMLTG